LPAASGDFLGPACVYDSDLPLRVAEHIFVGSKAQREAIADDAPKLDKF
jgi:hypothetical protein